MSLWPGRQQPGQSPRSEKSRGFRYDPGHEKTPEKLQVKRFRLDQHRVTRPVSAEVQRVAAAGVVHVDMPAIKEQRLALFGVTERGVAAFVGEVVGLGLDDARSQPQVAVAMADNLAEQALGHGLGITVEKAVGQGWHADGSWLGRRDDSNEWLNRG